MAKLFIDARGLDRPSISELENLLSESDWIDSVSSKGNNEPAGFDPITVSVVATGVILGTGIITRVVDWWSERSANALVIDARGDDLVIESRPDLVGHDGKIIIVTNNQTKVSVTRPHGAFTADELISALRSGLRSEQLPGTQDEQLEL